MPRRGRRLRRAVLPVAVLILAGAAVAGQDASLSAAIAAARRGDWDAAAALDQAYLAAHARSAAAWNLAGFIADHRSAGGEADKDYRTALKWADSKPLRAAIESNLGNHFLLRGDRDGARQAFAAALELDPADDEARLQLASLELAACAPGAAGARSDAPASAACGKRALAIFDGLPARARKPAAVGVLHVRLLLAAGERRQAEAAALAMRGDAPGGAAQAKLDYSLGQAFFLAQDCTPAAGYWRRAWQFAGGDGLRLQLATAEFCAGAPARPAAAADFAALQKAQPGWWQPDYYLARILAERGDRAGATRLLVAAEPLAKAAHDHGQGAALVAAALGSLCMQQGFWRDALDEWQAYARWRPDDPAGQRSLAISAEISGQDRVAEAAMHRYVAARPRDAAGHFLLALIEKNRGEMPEAAAELSEAVRLDPRLAPAWAAQGRMQLDAGDLEAAGQSLRRALAADPGDVQALTALAECEARGGRPAAARGLLQRALALQPENVTALYQLSQIDSQTGRLAEARALRARFEAARRQPRPGPGGGGLLAYFRADLGLDAAAQRQHYIRYLQAALASQHDPGLAARLEARLGVAEWQAGQRTAAQRDCERALASPAGALPYADALRAAEALAAADAPDEALAFYDRAAAAAPAADARAALGKARLLLALGRRTGALAVLAAIPAAAQPRGVAADLYGAIAAGAGDTRAAAAAFRFAVAQDPSNPRLVRDQALFLASQGRWSAGIQVLDAALARQPQAIALKLDRAILLQLANRRAQAQQELKDLAANAADPQLGQDETLAALLLGISYYTSDRRADAAAIFAQLAARPDLPRAQAALAWYYRALLDQADAGQALLWCRRSLALAPHYAPALYLRAQLLERRNDDGAAMAAAHAAIQAEPDWSAPHYLLARLLRRQGETAAATAEMQAVSRLQNTSPRSELANLLVALEEQP